MNNEEIQSLIKQLKGAGLEDEQIMENFYEMFKDGEMNREDLETLAKAMGYELTDDFKNDSAPDPIEAEKGEDEKVGDLSKAELEDAKEIEPGQTKEEFKEEIDELKGDEDKVEVKEEDDKEEVEDDDDEDEEEDWEEAQKLFKA